jgi:hypothetical protein
VGCFEANGGMQKMMSCAVRCGEELVRRHKY